MNLDFYLKKGARRAGRIVTNGLFHAPSRLARRKTNHWVFGSSFDKFDGNTKYLFLWVTRHRPDIQATWITGSRAVHDALRRQGLPVSLRWSPEGIQRTLEAKLAIFVDYASDVNVALLGGARLVNLWHGVGIKGIEHLSKLGGPRSQILKQRQNPVARVAFLERFLDTDLFLSTSSAMTDHFARCFRLPPERFFEGGYPRQDAAIDETLRHDAIPTAQMENVQGALSAGKRVAVYMPTWRNTGRPFLEAAFPDWSRLDDVLGRSNTTLFLKLHHHTASENLDALKQSQNIRLLPQGSDPYVILTRIDCLVTDYSSVLYDYIQHRSSGVVIYSFDESAYLAADQSMVAPFDDNVIGVRARTFERLCEAFENGESFAPLDNDRLAALREKFWATSTTLASPQIVNRLIQLAKDN